MNLPEDRPADASLEGLDDAALAAGVMRGARDVEEELCRRFFPRVMAYGLRHLRGEADAADLAQSVLCMVIEKLRANEVREPARLSSFVLGMTRNVARAWRRGDSRRRAILESAAPMLQERARYELDAALLEKDRLAACLEALPDRQRTIVLLTFYAERESGEIAREMGMTAGNVRVSRHRAVVSLRDCVTGGEG